MPGGIIQRYYKENLSYVVIPREVLTKRLIEIRFENYVAVLMFTDADIRSSETGGSIKIVRIYNKTTDSFRELLEARFIFEGTVVKINATIMDPEDENQYNSHHLVAGKAIGLMPNSLRESLGSKPRYNTETGRNRRPTSRKN